MNAEEARAIVLDEGFASDGTPEGAMFIMVRMGEEPSRERLYRLLTAIKVLFDSQVGRTMMDRQMAAALWTLGNQVSSNLESWARNGRQWSQEFEYDAVDLITAVESVFYDVWVVDREAHHMSVTLPTRQTDEQQSQEYRWTAEAFYKAAAAGAFTDPARLELIHGRIIEKMPTSPLHAALTNIIADALRAALCPPLTVRSESAIHIDFDGEPIPDVSAVTGVNQDYLARHPTPAEVALLVEVAVTSSGYGLGGKALLYAQAGIGDYWVALPETGEVMVHREPTPDGYGDVTRVGIEAMVSPLAAPDAVLAVCDLLGLPAAGEEVP